MDVRQIFVFVVSIFVIVLLNQSYSCAGDDMAMFIKDPPMFSLPQASFIKSPINNIHSGFGSQHIYQMPGNSQIKEIDKGLVRWIKSNVSSKTGMFLSFQVLPEEKQDVYSAMGAVDSIPGIIERVIVDNGLVIYDGAVGQIALALAGGDEEMRLAEIPIDVYWKGKLGALTSIRAGYPNNNFVYDPQAPEVVSSNLDAKGKRGFVFRIINANGDYLSPDPLDGKKTFEGFPTWPDIHWEDWKPVAGENAWVVIAAMQIYHKKYYDTITGMYDQHWDATELRLSEEIARAAIVLQAETGGIRMAPIGTYRENEIESATTKGSWWYNQISTENNLSWYSAFRMLYRVTGKEAYLSAMKKMEGYFQLVFNREGQFFYQGMSFYNGVWSVNASDFAVDVQTWGILTLGVDVIDGWFGDGAAYAAWQKAKNLSSTYDTQGQLAGVGYTTETGRISVEWTAGAIMATRQMAEFYERSHAEWSSELSREADEMRAGMELLRRDLPGELSAYAYSSKRGWIPFGWNSHDPRVLSLASTGWMIFVDQAYNPFFIDGNKKDGSSIVSARNMISVPVDIGAGG